MSYRQDPARPRIKGSVSAKQICISLPAHELELVDQAAVHRQSSRSKFFRDAARDFVVDPRTVITICLSLTDEDIAALDAKATAANVSRSELLRAAAKHQLQKATEK